jgi:hypothetical protein
MISYTMEIKNLSIALECLSRIRDTNTSYREVEKLLEATIEKQKELCKEPMAASPPKTTAPDDDIPF